MRAGNDRDGRAVVTAGIAAKAVRDLQAPESKNRAMFPGSDAREFWQRAEDRNRDTAEVYDQLGLAEYEAIEGFVRWFPGWQAGA